MSRLQKTAETNESTNVCRRSFDIAPLASGSGWRCRVVWIQSALPLRWNRPHRLIAFEVLRVSNLDPVRHVTKHVASALPLRDDALQIARQIGQLCGAKSQPDCGVHL